MQLITLLPATCELCGKWLPAHSSSCPRNGIHPSQWSLETNLEYDEWLSVNDKEEPLSTVYDKHDSIPINSLST
ncbi:hypothetical protein G6F64_007629 [Rhizopus arrhizus]|uniref:Uncharacterized protein n=1 Tax=Rhizopus oryzae TaxID=64495 RepID=A0A9P6X6F5_RHIOR|nr:hypothetical protein G6F64_007629 [Rhizopus arrhizus]